MSEKNDIRKLFIVNEDVDRQNIEALATRALKFGRVALDGTVVIDAHALSKNDQLKLALVIRYLGNCLDENIKKQTRPMELVKTLHQRIESVGAGLSKLASEGFAKKEGHGEYSAYPYRIDQFLRYLEEYGSNEAKAHKNRPRSLRSGGAGSKERPLSGAGAHIQRLIDEGFFSTPRLMSEVAEKLEEENVFRDERVIDKTIRKTFVSSRRSLQRIRNDGGGKARWRYVVRK